MYEGKRGLCDEMHKGKCKETLWKARCISKKIKVFTMELASND